MNKCGLGLTCQFKVEGIDLEHKKIPVVLSDESEVVRFNFSDGRHFIRLLHGEENVDLSRKDILSLFINHEIDNLPTAIFEDVRLEDRKMKAMSVFDESDPDSMKIFNKLSKGFLKSFSVGIDIIERVFVKEEDGIKFFDITRWALKEASVVGIPAIPTAKVGLSDQNENNGENRNQALAANQNSTQGNSMEYTKEKFEALEVDHAKALTDAGTNATATALASERERVSGIMALNGNAEFTAKYIEDGSSVGDVAIALVKTQGEALKKKKTDFENANEDLNKNNESETTDENLSVEAKLEKEAEKALDEHFKEGK